ncbi:MAG: hypothetical protein EBV03_01445 [Proteobacteria bacterium]|nr:hypothetical protein [Pseudomonadota bacterium]
MAKKGEQVLPAYGEIRSQYLATQEKLGTEAETAAVLVNYESLPEAYKPQFMARVYNISKNPNNAPDFIKSAQGLDFEMSRLQHIIAQGKETLAPEGFEVANPEKKTYTTYAVPDGPAPKSLPIEIQNDVGLMRDGKPFVYETKLYPARDWGRIEKKKEKYETPAQNQLLKYNAAIEQGLISGATVEIRGRVNKQHLEWMYGSAINRESPIPHVQLIYSVPLPSGEEYRFSMKRSDDPTKELRFTNNDRAFTPEDRAVIVGLERALRQQDKKLITEIIAGTSVKDPSEALKPFLDDPTKITDRDIWREYAAKRKEAMWEAALSARPPIYNEQNKESATAEKYAEPENARAIIREAVEGQQAYLRGNPQMMAIKKSYVLGMPDKPGYAAKVDAVVENAYQKVKAVRDYELERAASAEEPRRRAERKTMGWKGMPEGVALDIDHIIMDAIMEVNKGPKQKGRSYDQPERFYDLATVIKKLTPDLNRATREVQVFDPLAEGPKRRVEESYGAKDFGKIDKKEKEITADNIARAKAVVGGLKQREGGDGEPLKHEEKAILKRVSMFEKKMQGMEDTIARLTGEISELGPKMGKAGPGDEREGLRTRQNDLKQQAAEQEKALEAQYKEVLGDEKWRATARTISVQEKNIIKFIYVVNGEGKLTLSEEEFGGDVTGRAAHSELAQGKNIYAAGEIAFRKKKDTWVLDEINNGSGHYRPHESSLMYAKAIFEKDAREVFKASGPDAEARVQEFMREVKLVDALARGRNIRDASLIFDPSPEANPASEVAAQKPDPTSIAVEEMHAGPERHVKQGRKAPGGS